MRSARSSAKEAGGRVPRQAVRTHLERRGTPIGPNDLLIAAQAPALDLTVVSASVDEFARVPRLPVENWLDGGP